MGVKKASVKYRIAGDSAPAGEDAPAGLERSEVGLIPEDWNITALGALGAFSKGRGVRRDEASSGELPCVRYGELYTHHNDIVREFNSHISQSVASGSAPLKQGDILFAGSGETKEEIGKSAAFLGPEPAYAGSDIVILSPSNSDSAFLGYALNVNYVVRQKAAMGQGDAVVHITSSSLANLIVALPSSMVEQQDIASTLSDADALIESLQQLLAKKLALRQGAMQELLTGRTRLPGCRGKWVVKSLGEVGEISGAGIDKKSRMGEMPVRLLNYMDVYKGKALKSENFWHKVTAKSDQVLRCSIRRGDIFFTPTSEVRDDIGLSAVALEDVADVVYSYHVVRLRLLEDWDVRFRGYAFKTQEFLSQASIQCEGSGTRYVITLPKFRSMKVSYPLDIKEQTAIATVLADMDAEIDGLEDRLAKTRDLKAGMMQALLTGRIRLPPDQAA